MRLFVNSLEERSVVLVHHLDPYRMYLLNGFTFTDSLADLYEQMQSARYSGLSKILYFEF